MMTKTTDHGTAPTGSSPSSAGAVELSEAEMEDSSGAGGVLVALLLPAVQKVREQATTPAADRALKRDSGTRS